MVAHEVVVAGWFRNVLHERELRKPKPDESLLNTVRRLQVQVPPNLNRVPLSFVTFQALHLVHVHPQKLLPATNTTRKPFRQSYAPLSRRERPFKTHIKNFDDVDWRQTSGLAPDLRAWRLTYLRELPRDEEVDNSHQLTWFSTYDLLKVSKRTPTAFRQFGPDHFQQPSSKRLVLQSHRLSGLAAHS